MERMFQGKLVLRTRCLECERYTERREDFQNISVPVQEDEPQSPDCSPESERLLPVHTAGMTRIISESKTMSDNAHLPTKEHTIVGKCAD